MNADAFRPCSADACMSEADDRCESCTDLFCSVHLQDDVGFTVCEGCYLR